MRHDIAANVPGGTIPVLARRPEFARIRLALGASAIFGDMPSDTLDALAEAAVLERHDRAGCVDRVDSSNDMLWFVLEGGLLLYWVNVRGETIPIAAISPGSFYNTASLVEGGKRTWQCHAERRTALAVIAGPVVRQRAREDADFALCLSRILLQRYQAIVSAYADAIAEPLGLRIARRLLGQALASAVDKEVTEIQLSVSQTDLARTLGVSRSKLNTELRRLEKTGVLRLGYGQIHVRNIDALERISGGKVFVF